MSSLNKEQNIVLFDSNTNLKNLKNIISKKKSLIITFDYKSHEILSRKKIPHEISDTFLDQNKLQFLQNESFRLAKWFETKISQSIIYKNINLGELFYIDFYVFLLPILKKVFETIQISKQYPKANFFASYALYEMIKPLSKYVISLGGKKYSTQFYLDSISNRFKIGGRSFTIRLSQKRYNSLKKLSESFFKYFFKQHYDYSKKSHILIEFDPLKYQELFLTSPKNSNFVVYNRRRPYFWNFHSFSIFKKSNVSFFTDNELIDSEIQNNLENASNWYTNANSELVQHDEFFNDFFKIDGKSFWNVIKKPFFYLCKTRFQELIYEIECANKLFEITNPSTITVWSELGSSEQILVNIAKNRNVPVILLQHGYYHDDISATNFNYFSGVLPKKADYFLIWGNKTDDYCKSINLESKKIKIIGSPFYDGYENFNSNISKSNYVLLAAQGPTDFFISDLKNSTYENYIKTIVQICNITKKLQKKLIIKLHPDPHDLDITKYVEHLNSNVQVIKSGNIRELIQNCELFLSIDISTTILEAHLLHKPVISISVKDYQLGDSNSQIFQSCIYIDIIDLENQMSKIFKDSEFKNKIISSGSKFVDDYLSNQNSSSEAFITFLNDF